MKLLRISEHGGQFLAANGDYNPIDKIGKDDLLRLVDSTLDKDEVEMDAYDDQAIKNQAHQVIYKSIVQKLTDLRKRRQSSSTSPHDSFWMKYEKYRE